MLNFLRKKKVMKRVLWALAIIIIPAFVFWGAGSLSRRKPAFKYVGTIDGKKVPIDDFIKSTRDVQVGLFLNYFGQPVAFDKIRKDRKLLNRFAWENLIVKKAAKKDNITVSDEEVINFIESHPLFQRNGVFDEKLYHYILKNSLGLMPRTFEESVRDSLIGAKYRDYLIKSVAVSNDGLLSAYKEEFEMAKVNYLLINKESFISKVTVSEDAITRFYGENKELFREPEKIVLWYIEFPHREEGSKENALRDMQKAYNRLQRRAPDMEKEAEALGLKLSETPPFQREELVPDIETEGIRNIGPISSRLRELVDVLPIINENEKGVSYIIAVKKKLPSRIKPEEKVSAYIVGLVREKKALELAREEAEEIYRKALKRKRSLLKIADDYGMELHRTELISRFDYIKGVGESYGVVSFAFTLKPGEISEPIEVRKGFVLIEPISFFYIDIEKFEKEKADYRSKVLSVKKMKALEDWFQKRNKDSSLAVDLDML